MPTTRKSRLLWLLAVTTWPLMIGGGVLAALVMMNRGVAPALIVTGLALVSGAWLVALQQVLPYEPAWRGRPKDFTVDTLHSVLTGLVSDATKAASLGVLTGLSIVIASAVGGALWPGWLPLWVQLGLALLIGDLGASWVHRLGHESDALWRVHAMHHTSERMYVLASGRNHPINVLMAFTAQIAPLIVLGASAEVLTLVAVFTSINGLLQHANVAFVHGPLNWLFATADVHRWHHSPVLTESKTNYGSNIMVWDHLFGTYYLPADREIRTAGIPELAVPTNLWSHLVVPFSMRKFEVARGAARTCAPTPQREAAPPER